MFTELSLLLGWGGRGELQFKWSEKSHLMICKLIRKTPTIKRWSSFPLTQSHLTPGTEAEIMFAKEQTM